MYCTVNLINTYNLCKYPDTAYIYIQNTDRTTNNFLSDMKNYEIQIAISPTICP